MRLRRHRQADCPRRPFDLLLPRLPALTSEAAEGRGAATSVRAFGAAPFFIEHHEDFERMANTPQAKKRIRRNANRATINHSRISRIRTFIKAVESAIEAGKKKDAAEALKMVQPEMARGVARGVIHKNTASRKFSRLSKRVASLG